MTRPSVRAGLWAVVRLFLTALDDLVAALAGARPLRADAHDVARLVGEAYRTGKHRVAEGDVIEADDINEGDE